MTAQITATVELLQWLFDYFRRYGVRVLQVNGSFSPDYPGLELLSYEMTDAVLEAAIQAENAAANCRPMFVKMLEGELKRRSQEKAQ